MDKKEVLKKLNEHLPLLKGEYPIKEMGVFGSFVRGEERDGSDLDILVEFERPIGLLKFIDLENYLSDLVGVKVDLVSKKGLKPRIGKSILKEVVNI